MRDRLQGEPATGAQPGVAAREELPVASDPLWRGQAVAGEVLERAEGEDRVEALLRVISLPALEPDLGARHWVERYEFALVLAQSQPHDGADVVPFDQSAHCRAPSAADV